MDDLTTCPWNRAIKSPRDKESIGEQCQGCIIYTWLKDESSDRDWSEATAQAYHTAAKKLGVWRQESNAQRFKGDDPNQFSQWLATGGFSKATRHLYLTAITRFYRWLYWQKGLSVEEYAILDKWSRGRRTSIDEQRLERIPRKEQVDKLLAAAHDFKPKTEGAERNKRLELYRMRNAALLETLLSTGCRISEVLGITRGNIESHGDGTGRAVVTGKGDKSRVVFFDAPAWAAVQTYLAARDAEVPPLDEHPLIARHDRCSVGKVLPIGGHGNSARVVFELLRKAGGVEQQITPHWLRHEMAMRALKQLNDIAMVSQLLGHSSTDVTMKYVHLIAEKQAAAHKLLTR